MSNPLQKSSLIFMKVGLHAQENLDDIIERKQREFQEAGKIFWGYGGNTCHPLSMVQPFAKEAEAKGNQVLIVMQKINSKHAAPPEIAKEYSDDGVNWQPIPKGIEVRGSRYALVLDELQKSEFDLNLRELEVGVGPSCGCKANKYLTGQVDKGCFVYSQNSVDTTDKTDIKDESIIKPIELIARVKSPFAVLLRS